MQTLRRNELSRLSAHEPLTRASGERRGKTRLKTGRYQRGGLLGHTFAVYPECRTKQLESFKQGWHLLHILGKVPGCYVEGFGGAVVRTETSLSKAVGDSGSVLKILLLLRVMFWARTRRNE